MHVLIVYLLFFDLPFDCRSFDEIPLAGIHPEFIPFYFGSLLVAGGHQNEPGFLATIHIKGL